MGDVTVEFSKLDYSGKRALLLCMMSLLRKMRVSWDLSAVEETWAYLMTVLIPILLGLPGLLICYIDYSTSMGMLC